MASPCYLLVRLSCFVLNKCVSTSEQNSLSSFFFSNKISCPNCEANSFEKTSGHGLALNQLHRSQETAMLTIEPPPRRWLWLFVSGSLIFLFQAQHQQPHLPSHRDLLHIAGMGSALGVGFQPSPPGSSTSEAEAAQKSANLSGSDILDAKSHDLR